MGVHSSLSLPLVLGDRTMGALNVYAYAKNAFGPAAVILGELFARPAAVSVHNAQVLADTQELVEQLTRPLNRRGTVDQTLGLIMSRTGVDPDEAFERLRDMSRRRGVKVAVLTQEMLTEAMNRGRARHSGPTPDAVDVAGG